jgi:hypothetical protein
MQGREACETEMPDMIAIGAGRASRCHFEGEVPEYADRLRAAMKIESDSEVTSQ